MAHPSLQQSTSLMWQQSEVLAIVESEELRSGRGWDEDTREITRPTGAAPKASTILLDEADLEEVMDLAALAETEGGTSPWWSERLAQAKSASWRTSAATTLRVLVQGMLFRLGWGHLGAELEAATEPSPPG